MNLKKINWPLSIMVVASLTIFILTRIKNFEEDYFQFGMDLNKTRDSLGVPKIESDWVTHETSPTTWFWGNKRVTTIEPIHLFKISKFSHDSLVSELDAFHYETDDSLAYRVILEFTFDNSTWSNTIIKYTKGKSQDAETLNLSLKQADSIINRWGLSR